MNLSGRVNKYPDLSLEEDWDQELKGKLEEEMYWLVGHHWDGERQAFSQIQ